MDTILYRPITEFTTRFGGSFFIYSRTYCATRQLLSKLPDASRKGAHGKLSAHT